MKNPLRFSSEAFFAGLTPHSPESTLPAMSEPMHALFVCTGNTCRSPMAEALFRHHLGARKDFTAGSAGVSASKGSPANRDTLIVLKRRGITLREFASRPVSKELLRAATHVFAMTQSHLDVLEARFPEYSAKFFLLREFAGMQDDHPDPDIPDPIGMGLAAYEETATILNAAMPSVIRYIESTPPPASGT